MPVITKAIIIPFAMSPHKILKKTMKKTQPNLFRGINGHGPNLSRLLTPKLADNIDEINVAKKKGSESSTTPLFFCSTVRDLKDCIKITRSTCDWGIASNNGSMKKKYSNRNASASV